MTADDNAVARALRAPSHRAPGRYEVRRELGGGGMAQVYEVYDTAAGRSLALKCARQLRDDNHSRHAAELLVREYHTLAQLAHPRIVSVCDFGIGAQGPFYTMELLDGGDLDSLAPCEALRACALARDVCSALSFLHSRRMLHRDVSAANVRCTADGSAKLIDFGTVTYMGPCKLLIGTPMYCPPEAFYMQPLDARADLFALGATLYFVLTGRHAYNASDFGSLPVAWRQAPVAPSKLVSGIPEGLDQLVLELLQPERELRPASAGEVMERLSLIADHSLHEHAQIAQSYLTAPVFVGRELELARVRRQASRASNGRGGTLLVRGPSGVGMSRFLDAGILAAKLGGFLVLRADAGDASWGEAGIARRLLWQLTRLLPNLISELDPGQGAALSALLPEGHILHASPANDVGLGGVGQASELTLALILSAAQQVPLLIAVDDIDASDESSLSLLAMLAHAAGQARLLVLASAPSGATVRAPLSFGLFARAASEITLQGFSLAETERLLASVFGVTGHPAHVALLAKRLHPLSGGNARNLMLLAQHIVDAGLATYSLGSWSLPTDIARAELPSGVSELLAKRLPALRPSARALARGLALSAELSFSFEECRRLSGHDNASALVVDLEQLAREQIVRGDAGFYGLVDRAFVPVLLNTLSPDEHKWLQRRLAGVFADRPLCVLRQARALLRAGDTSEALDLLLSASAGSTPGEPHDSARLSLTLHNLPSDWAEVCIQAIEACHVSGRPRWDEFVLRLGFARLASLIGNVPQLQLPTLIGMAVEASPLPEWAEQDPSLSAGERFQRAVVAAQARYAATPPERRLAEPLQAIAAVTECVRYTLGAAAPAYDVQAVRALPSLQPFYVVAPQLRVVEELKNGLYARLTGRWDDASELYHAQLMVLEHKSQLNVDDITAEHTSLLVLSALITMEAALGVRCAEAQIARLDSSPLFAVRAISTRGLIQLWSGDVSSAERLLQDAELMRLRNNIQQPYDRVALIWELQAYAAFEDASRLRRTLAEAVQVAESSPCWLPFVSFGQAQLLRLRGKLSEALPVLSDALSRLQAGEHHAWALLAAAHVQVLDGAGQSSEAIRLGSKYLEEAESLGPSACQPLLFALSVALARVGDARGNALAERALAHVEHLTALGAHRALAHEARAWVALLQRDLSAYQQHVTLLKAAVDTQAGTAFGNKLQRLQQYARHIGAEAV